MGCAAYNTLDDEGMLSIPEQPGLGLELDQDALTRYTGAAAD